MTKPASDSPPGRGVEIRETRFPLRVLLKEVAEELSEGSFGQQKLRRQDVRKIFRAKATKPRAPRN